MKDTPIGSIFGKLRMVGNPVDKGNGHISAEFECECGTVKEIYVSNAVKGKTTSCGCFQAESVTTHGHCKKGKRTLTYLSYHSMLARCLDPNHAAYDTYKSIKICDRWNPYEGGSYENFLEDLGERPGKLWTLDRVDTLLGYSAENCKWSTKSEQAFNQKRSSINTSGRTGVFWNKSRQRWVVQLMKEGKYYWIGQYKDYEEACLAVSAAELDLFGFQRDTYQ
jgi:hypothetical protein